MSNPIIAQPTVAGDSARNAHRSIWSDIGRVAGKALAFPFRTASTAVNAGIFSAYYVSTIAVSGLVLTGSALAAPVRIAVNHATGNNPGKSLSEYVISPAKKTYNFISRLYHELPEHASEKIFLGVTVGVVVGLAIVAMSEGSGPCGTFIYVDAGKTNHYHYGSSGHGQEHQSDSDNDSYVCRLLRAYKISTDIGAALMNKTTQLVNGHQLID